MYSIVIHVTSFNRIEFCITPWGVAFDDNGDLYVAERGNHRISIRIPTRG